MTPPTIPMPRLPRGLGDGPDTAPVPVPCPLGVVHRIDAALVAHEASRASATDALADLDAWLALHPAPVPAAPTPAHAPVWVWALIVATAAGLIVGLIVWSWT